MNDVITSCYAQQNSLIQFKGHKFDCLFRTYGLVVCCSICGKYGLGSKIFILNPLN